MATRDWNMTSDAQFTSTNIRSHDYTSTMSARGPKQQRETEAYRLHEIATYVEISVFSVCALATIGKSTICGVASVRLLDTRLVWSGCTVLRQIHSFPSQQTLPPKIHDKPEQFLFRCLPAWSSHYDFNGSRTLLPLIIC
jgi:hypothetical protein